MVRFGALGLSHHDIDAIRQEAMQFAGIGLLTIGPDGTIIYADRGILRIFELEDRYPDVVSAVGLVAGDIFGCADVLVNLAESAKARGRLHAMECQITTARGTRKWLLCDAYGLPASGQPFEAVQLMMRDISPRKRVQEQIARLNQCLLHLGTDPDANINMLTATAGDLLGADCALYNRLSNGMLCSIGQWRTPAGYSPTDMPDGHLCYDVIKGGAAEPVVVRDLPSTPYASTDPNVSLHGLRTYIGVAVRRMDEPVGSLCVVYRRDFEPASDDLALLAIVASAVGIEEAQSSVQEALREREATYRSVIEQSVENIYLLDIETGRVLESNPALQSILGYSAAELEMLRVHDFVAHGADDIAQSIRRVVSEGRVFIGDRLYRRKDGSLVDVEVSASLVRYRGRDVLSVVSRDMTERSKALRSLRESEAKYRNLVEQSLQGIVVAQSPPTRLVFANEAIGTILGYTPAELTSLSSEDIPALVHPEDRSLFFQRFQDRLTGRPLTSGYEFRGVRKDGTTCWLEISSSRIEYGGHPAIQATFLDISGRKQAEASLRQSEARYRMTLEAMSDAIHVVDRDLRILLFNQAFCAWNESLGLPKDVIGQTLFEVFPFLPSAVEDEYRGVFATGELLVTEETSRVADRQIITETRKIPMVENGVVVSVVTAIRDITDRRSSERALRESEERYRGLFNNATDLMFTLDLSGSITAINPSAIRHTGCRPEELLGIGFRDYVAAEDRRRLLRLFARVRRTGEALQDCPVGVIVKDGSRKLFEISVGPLRSGDDIVGFQGSGRDVTERKRLEEQLRQAAKMEAIGQLAGGIAHDFNNLLTGIIGYASILTKELPENSRAHLAARTIENTAERASDLTKQLLGFARRGKLQVLSVDLHRSIHEVVALLCRTMDPSIRMSLNLNARDATVTGDPAQMHQVLLNLGINARDAMPGGGELIFQTELVQLDDEYCRSHAEATPGPRLLLSVTDTGHGIPKEIQQRIFEPFFTTKAPGLGTGMGLATVYGIVRNHGGHIEVYSEPGMGATFKVYLPLCLGTGAGADAEAEGPAAIACAHGRVLVVDDEEVVRNVASDLLRELGHEVVTAESGSQAVQYYREHADAVDLVIIDLIMPEMDGRECYAELRKLNPSIRALLSTGFGMNGRIQEALDDGMSGFVQKPYRMAELGVKVGEALRM